MICEVARGEAVDMGLPANRGAVDERREPLFRSVAPSCYALLRKNP